MNKKVVSTVLTAAMFASLATMSVAAEENKVVKFALQGDKLTWQQDIVDKFEADTGYTVDVTLIPSDQDQYTKTMLLMDSAETCPDVIAEDGFMVKSDAAAGKLYCLDDALADWELDKFDPAILEGGKGVDGKLYGVMCSTDTQILYYNKNQIKALGLDENWQPKTWQEIIDVATQLKEANADKEDYIPLWVWASTTYPEETSMRTFQLLASGVDENWPSSLYDAEEGKWVIDRDVLSQSLGFIDTIFNEAQVAETPAQAADSSMGAILGSDFMMNENIGLYITGSWTMGQFASQYPWPEAMDTYGMAQIPTINGEGKGYTTISGGWTWAVPEGAPNKDGAVELLKYLCSYDGIMARVMYNGEASTRTDVAESDEYLNQTPSAIPFTKDQLEYAIFRPSVDGYSSITASYTTAVEEVAAGLATVDEAIDNLQNEVIRLFGEDKVIVK